jgi:exopolysaccharide biosynthesis polyprenyl glycosylphosphotransferase
MATRHPDRESALRTRTAPGDFASRQGAPWADDEARPRQRISRGRAFGLGLPALMILDALLVAASFLGALRLGPAAARVPAAALRQAAPQLIALFVVLVAGFLFLGGAFGLYSRRALLEPRRALSIAARSLFWSGAVAVAFAFLLALDPPGQLRWLLLAHAGLLGVAGMTLRPLAWHGLMRLAAVRPLEPRRLLVLGTGPESRRMAARLEDRSASGVEVIGLAGTVPERAGEGARWPRFALGSWDEAPDLADALAADEVLITAPRMERAAAARIAAALSRRGIVTQLAPTLTGMFLEGTPLHREHGPALVRLGYARPGALAAGVKRALDIVLTAAGGLILLPLLLAIAVAVKATSRGPVLYPQERVGRNGRTFRMYKFRSMVVSNDDGVHRRYVTSLLRDGSSAGTDANGRPIYKIVDDPRVTMIGRLIRATSLDELPQLINVLRGEMSLVGPRPCLPFEYDLYDDWQCGRLAVTPGMTGLWQVSGRSLLSFEDMVLLDLYYAANWSLRLDLKILGRTIPEVLHGGGAR